MGLFSFISKNKQESAAEDSGHYPCAAEQASTAQARSKRASSVSSAGPGRQAGPEPVDPVLPEKKRARRRLVGAIALALAVAVGLPMILDSEQKPLASDIAIQIPSRDQAPPAPAAPVVPLGASRVDAGVALDQSEEIVPPVPVPAPLPKALPAVAPADSVPAPSLPMPSVPVPSVPAALPKAPRVEVKKIDASKADTRHEGKAADTRAADTRAADTRDVRRADEKMPAAAGPGGDDAARARAILEGKPAASAHDAAGAKFVLQVAALASQEKVDELQARLRQAGISSYTQKTPNVAATRVRLGPFASKEEADRVRAKLNKIGLDGFLVPS